MGIMLDAISIIIITGLMCGMICGFIAFSRDRNWIGFALLGLLLGPIGLVVTSFAEPSGAAAHGPDDDPTGTRAPINPDIDTP